jgi:predicted metalloendopeptidase
VWCYGCSYVHWLLRQGITQFSVLEWRYYLEFVVLWNGHQFDPDLPSDVYFRQHDTQGPIGRGARLYHRLPRRERGEPDCVRATQHLVPGLLAEAFLAGEPDLAATRAEVRTILGDVLAALRARVATATWLGDADRAALDAKLRATVVRVAEPDHWTVEPFGARLAPDRHDHNMNLVRAYRVERNLGLWTQPWDRNAMAFFAMPLTEVNAYWSGPTNTITVLAGLLQRPFWSADYGRVSKYAILGSVLGHEQSHALDPHGLFWDAEGAMRPASVLSAAGLRAFFDRADCVVEEYGPAPGGCQLLNMEYGNATLAEDMADLVGVSAAFDAAGLQSLGDRQHFFMVLAQAFCESFDQEHVCDAVEHDVHAVAEFRIDRTLRNMPEFHAAFGCHDGQRMFRREPCRVWAQ